MMQQSARRLRVNARETFLTGDPTSSPEAIMVFLSSAMATE
jgi:hypothetical protein